MSKTPKRLSKPFLVLTITMLAFLCLFAISDDAPSIFSSKSSGAGMKGSQIIRAGSLAGNPRNDAHLTAPPLLSPLGGILDNAKGNVDYSALLAIVCGSKEVAAKKAHCASFVASGLYDSYPPKDQEIVRCHGGSMVKPYTEEAVKKEWEERHKAVHQAAAENNKVIAETAAPIIDVDDAHLTLIAINELRNHSTIFRKTADFSMDKGKAEPKDPMYLSHVLHGGVSPATMASQQVYMKDLLGLGPTFEDVESATKIAAKAMMSSEDLIQWKIDLLAKLKESGRISIAGSWDGLRSRDPNPALNAVLEALVQKITVHPDTVLVELGTGAGTVLYSMCPPDPFDLSTACLGADIVKIFVASSVTMAPHLRLGEGYGFPLLPPGTATHLLSHGIATPICEECLCGHISEGLRLLGANGTLVIWMIRSKHHNNNIDPSYFNGTYAGPHIGAQPPTDADAFFFMDKCRYKYGVHLSPFVDPAQLEIFLDYPTPLYSACWERDGFFGVRLRRNANPWGKGAKFSAMTPENFIAINSLDTQLAELSKDNFHQMVSPNDLCDIKTSGQQMQVFKEVMARRFAEKGSGAAPSIAPMKPKSQRQAVPLTYLSPLMQTWILDLVLTDLAHNSRKNDTPQQAVVADTKYETLPKEWCFNRLVDDMIYERTARIEHAFWIGSKCKAGKTKYWCRNKHERGKQHAAHSCS